MNSPLSFRLPWYGVMWNVILPSLPVRLHLASHNSKLITVPGCLALLRPIFRKFIPGLSSGNTTYPTNGLSHPSNTNNTYRNSIALRHSRSPNDMDHYVIEGQRAFSYPDYDAISLPGATKDGNSISRQGFMRQREESMTDTDVSPGVSPRRGSLSSV